MRHYNYNNAIVSVYCFWSMYIKNMNNKENAKEQEKEIVCCYCCEGTIEDSEDECMIYENVYCQSCYDDYSFTCDKCDCIGHTDDCHSDSYNRYCESCYDRYFFRCQSCESITHNDNMYGDCYCEDCGYNEDSEERYHRKYNKTDIFGNAITDDFGNISKRIFSAEIECYDKNNNLEIVHNDSNFEMVGITGDGSLDDDGIEFVTPMLRGQKGFDLLQGFTELLNKNDFSVDTTCGLHIHLDAKDYLSIKDTENSENDIDNFYRIKNLFLFCLVFEDIIMSFLPFSRRNNTYCNPLNNFYNYNEIENCRNQESFEKIWYREQNNSSIDEKKKEKYDRSRYAGINFHSLLGNGHIEIRHHSGTTNFEKIKNWIVLWNTILDFISCQGSYFNDFKKNQYLLNLNKKTQNFFDIIGLDKDTREFLVKRQKLFGGDEDTEDTINDNQNEL
jgi:hypothetical protein